MNKVKAMFTLIATFTLISASTLWAEEKKFEKFVPEPEITAQIASNPELITTKIKEAMIRRLEGPASVTIDITPISPEATALGKFKRVFVLAENATINHLCMEQAKIEFLDVELDTTTLIKKNRIKPVNKCEINMDVIINENDLNELVKYKAAKNRLTNPKVKINENNMELSAVYKYGIVKVEFWARGNFSIKDDKELWFYSQKLKVNRMTMPRGFVGSIIKKINPILKLDLFDFKLNLETIKLNPGKIRLSSYPID